MSAVRIVAVTGVLGFVLVAPTLAQGLGDTASREKAKRAANAEAKKEKTKSFTNEDLEAGRPPGTKPDSSGAGAEPAPSEDAPAPAQAPPPGAGEDRLTEERSYRDAITAAQQGVTAAETKIRQLSEKLNPMSLSYIYGAGGSNDANEELRVRADLRDAESQLQAARQALVSANQNLQGFRQGRPPGPLEER
jgi:hypothetical protein